MKMKILRKKFKNSQTQIVRLLNYKVKLLFFLKNVRE